MNSIFISYREDDAKPWALILRDAMVDAFGEDHVFLDKDALHAGSWREQLDAALAGSAVVLVVIGKRWLDASDAQGRRRLELEDDVHRQEIVAALAHPGVTVIPVQVENALLPPRDALPPPLQPLLEQQARVLGDNAARRSVDLALIVADVERASGLRARRKPAGLLGRLGRGARTLLLAFVATLAAATAFELGGARMGAMDTLVVFIFVLAAVAGYAAWRGRRHRTGPPGR